MNIVLLGVPGAGKGTLAENLHKEFNMPHIATGDIFRDAVKNKTELGIKAKSYMDKGALVPDDIVIGIVKGRLNQKDCKNGFILDGFPRTIAQAEALDKITKIDIVINLKARDETIVKRISSRRLCTVCQAVYNVISLKPKQEGICDKCGGKLIQREDDMPEVIRKRLKTYRNETEPLIKYYSSKKLLKIISAEQTIEKIFSDTLKILNCK